jgi:TRAP-type C4-dicarboxylate transport system permease small subunit
MHNEWLAKGCAILAGALLTVITLMTCVSLIGRNTTGWTIVGDFELSGAAAGAAIALFLPWCQLRRAHIIVDFFTARARCADAGAAGPPGRAAAGAGMALMTWRTTMGGLNAWSSGVGTDDDGLSGVDRLRRHGAAAGPVHASSPLAQAVAGFGDGVHE